MRLFGLIAVAATLVVGGCVSLFPKTPPAQLYRFGGDMTPASQPTAIQQPRFAVQSQIIDVNRASAGDLILTMSGNEAAYIKGARWVGAASSLFEQALANAFGADHGPARLMARGEGVRPDFYLKLEVRTFEARYLSGQGAAPTIVVEVYAALSHPADRALAGEHTFTASIPATENRVSAIVAAFDQAVDQVLGQLTKWVDDTGSGYSGAKPA